MLGRALCLCLVFLVSFAAADYPVHCLLNDVAGVWRIEMGMVNPNSQSLMSKCVVSETKASIEVTLSLPNIARVSGDDVGTWTMIYDQGLEVVVNGQKFFHFFNFTIGADGNVTSDCGHSLPDFGWYHDVPTRGFEPANWGCYQATMITNSPSPFVHPAPPPPEWHGGIPLTRTRALSRPGAVPTTLGDERAMKELPEEFDWSDVSGVSYVAPMRDQLTCGSCYAFAGTAMLESRARIKSKELNDVNFMLSPQSIVSCSAYTQGCDGGFPYLVAKFSEDFTIPSDLCFPYESGIVLPNMQPSCTKQCNDTAQHFRATDYKYVGGYFGNCSELAMMQELVTKGPLAVGISVPDSFMDYRGGIYVEKEHEKKARLSGDMTFKPTDHAVLVVGYGVEDGVKFWRVKNSWGRHFGETGYFRVRRGTDEIAIESMAVSSDIYLPPSLRRPQFRASSTITPQSSTHRATHSMMPERRA